MIMLFVLLMVNFTLMSGTAAAVGSCWARVYFISFHILAVWVIMGVFVAFIIEHIVRGQQRVVGGQQRVVGGQQRVVGGQQRVVGWSELDGKGKVLFVMRVCICIGTFGMVFPNAFG